MNKIIPSLLVASLLALLSCSQATSSPNNNSGGSNSNPNATPATLNNCQVFPADNPWNQDVSALPVHANSDGYIQHILANGGDFVHPDFGSNPDFGIPFTVVPGTQALVPINFTDFGDESDPGPYPIPPNAPIEGGSDRHVLAIDDDNCILYELFNAFFTDPGWDASSGAAFDLNSNDLRPDGWTSADAAGLPIFSGLARYDEAVESGQINHALRFTVSTTQAAYIHPATHLASNDTDSNAPPMGLRLRLKADYDISSFTGAARVIVTALKTYGMILADNGSNWFISGSTDTRWDDEDLDQLKDVPGSAFEAVETGPLIFGP